MLGASAKPDEGDVGSLARSHRPNLVDFDLARSSAKVTLRSMSYTLVAPARRAKDL
jgi:hypothetical protein